MNKVSVIIPVYNAGKYLKDTIDSILSQTFKSIELIIVDDGSTDDSVDIINNFKDSRIKLIRQKNQGAPNARNNGFLESSGKYIYFFDSDDIMKENAIELLVDEIECGHDIVCGNYNYIDKDGKLIKDNEIKMSECKIYKSDDIFKRFPYISIFPNNKLFKREIIEKYNVYFDNVKIGQDLNFLYKYILHCKSASQISSVVCSYRLTDNSISRTYSKKIFDLVNSFDLVRSHYALYSEEKKYDDYFGLHEKIQYCSQLLKMRFFDNKDDRKEIFKYFNNYIKKAKFNKNFMVSKFIQINGVRIISCLSINNCFYKFRKKIMNI